MQYLVHSRSVMNFFWIDWLLENILLDLMKMKVSWLLGDLRISHNAGSPLKYRIFLSGSQLRHQTFLKNISSGN